MMEDGLVIDGNRWSLSNSSVSWTESTNTLIIRELRVTYRDVILNRYPHCVKLIGKSGRGRSVFLRYLIFYILLEAQKLVIDDAQRTPHVDTHLTDPRIAFMDRDNVLYHITKETITVFGSLRELVSAVGQPHYYFSDDVDINDARAGLLATMALESWDGNVLKEFSKRMDEAHTMTRSNLIMTDSNLSEMLEIFFRRESSGDHI